MKLRSMLFGGLLAVAGLALATPAHAAFIVGDANFTLGAVTVSTGEIDFTPPFNPGVDATPTYGGFDVQSGAFRSGVFTNPLFGGADVLTDFIRDLSSNPGDANFVPVGAGNTPNFLVFPDFPTWRFTETFLQPGINVGPVATPFIFTQIGPNVTVSMSMNGIAFDTTTPTQISAWTLVISAQFTNTNAANLINIITSGGTLPDNSWSGTFSASAVPEPATLVTFGLGSMYLARRRRNQKKA